MTMFLFQVVPVTHSGPLFYQPGLSNHSGGRQDLFDQCRLSCTGMARQCHIPNLGCLIRHLNPPSGLPGRTVTSVHLCPGLLSSEYLWRHR